MPASHGALPSSCMLSEQAALGKAEKICIDRLLPRTKVAAFGIDVERGYGNPKLHAISRGCANQTYRQPIQKVVPRIEGVDAIRISVSGWEAWILADLKVTPAGHA